MARRGVRRRRSTSRSPDRGRARDVPQRPGRTVRRRIGRERRGRTSDVVVLCRGRDRCVLRHVPAARQSGRRAGGRRRRVPARARPSPTSREPPTTLPITKHYVVAPRSRRTIWIRQEDAALVETQVGARLHSSVPIVAERAMWWPARRRRPGARATPRSGRPRADSDGPSPTSRSMPRRMAGTRSCSWRRRRKSLASVRVAVSCEDGSAPPATSPSRSDAPRCGCATSSRRRSGRRCAATIESLLSRVTLVAAVPLRARRSSWKRRCTSAPTSAPAAPHSPRACRIRRRPDSLEVRPSSFGRRPSGLFGVQRSAFGVRLILSRRTCPNRPSLRLIPTSCPERRRPSGHAGDGCACWRC